MHMGHDTKLHVAYCCFYRLTFFISEMFHNSAQTFKTSMKSLNVTLIL